MGCSDSYETNNQTMKSQSPNTYFNKPIPTEYDLHFKIPKMPSFSLWSCHGKACKSEQR